MSRHWPAWLFGKKASLVDQSGPKVVTHVWLNLRASLFIWLLCGVSVCATYAQNCGQGSSQIRYNGVTIASQSVCQNDTFEYTLSGAPLSEPSWTIIPSSAGEFEFGDNTGMSVRVTWLQNPPDVQVKLRVDYPDMGGSQCGEVLISVKIFGAPSIAAPDYICSGSTLTLDAYGNLLSPGAVWQSCTSDCSNNANWVTIGTVAGSDPLVIQSYTQSTYFRTRVDTNTECGYVSDNSTPVYVPAIGGSNLNVVINDPGPICASDLPNLEFQLQPGSVVGSNPVFEWKRNGGVAEADLDPDPTVYRPPGNSPYEFEFGETIQLVVATTNPCDQGQASNLVTITQKPIVYPTFNGIQMIGQACEGKNVQFVANTSIGNISGDWWVGSGGFASTTSNYAPPADDISDLVVHFSGTLSGTCGNQQVVTDHTDPIVVFPAPEIFAGDVEEVCSGQAILIGVTSSIPGSTFTWAATHDGVSGPSSGSGPTISHTLIVTTVEPGTATYTITTTSPDGCTDDLQLIATVNPNPTNPALSIDPYCDFEVVTLKGNITEEIIDYKWFRNSSEYLGRGLNLPLDLAPEGVYEYQYKAIDKNSCQSEAFGQVHVSVLSACDEHLNWLETITYSYDPTNPGDPQMIGHSKSYYDPAGQFLQSQMKWIGSNQTWASQSMFDQFQRPVISTLMAPINSSTFQYKHRFVTDINDQLYDYTRFDQPVGGTPGTLGWYYSSNNNIEEHVPETGFPYSRTDFYEDGTGEVRRTSGPGEHHRLGSNHEILGGTFPVFSELEEYLAARLIAIPGIVQDGSLVNEGVQSVRRDQNGRYSVTISDKSGKVVMTARQPGQGESLENALHIENSVEATSENPLIYFYLLHAQEVGIEGTGTYVIEDLVTGLPFTPEGDWPVGFYRIIVSGGSIAVEYENNFLDVAWQFYDDAGRLRASMSPNGFVQFRENQGQIYEEDSQDNPVVSSPIIDLTSYQYNHQGWLLEMSEPDAGRTEYVYRKDGKIRFSQNAEQRVNNRFSYTQYDNLGRPVESGEYVGTNLTFTGMGSSSYSASAMKAEVEKKYDEVSWSNSDVRDWVRTHYDHPASAIPDLPEELSQEFVRGAVSWTENINIKTWYSYDEFGRVIWMAQKPAALDRIFLIEYQYDFLGNVLQVSNAACLAGERLSPFFHHYEYDADSRLSKVHTSSDGITQKLRATYEYYLHGPLKRIELGEAIQGIDFVYNIQGWLTQINHPDGGALDPGGDGEPGGHSNFRPDAFGMVLDYFESSFEGMYQSTSYKSNSRFPGGVSPSLLADHSPLLRVLDTSPENLGLRRFSADNPEYIKLLDQLRQQK